MARKVDPITMQLIRNSLDAIVDEMALTVVRTAYSTVVRDNMDYSTCFLNKDGVLMAQGLTIPIHLGAMPPAIAAVKREWGDSFQPGDIYILNDPYDGGAHLPDIYMFKPIFFEGSLAGFTVALAHHTDVGGRVAGSNASDSTEIYQEGLRIPPLPLYTAGKPNRTLFDLIERNVRVPTKVIGDLRAQMSACFVGEQRYFEILTKYGFETVDACMEELLDYSERLMRAEIAALPDGVYRFRDHIDDDGIDPDPIPIQVTITVAGDRMTVDYTGSSPQVRGAINCPIPTTRAGTYAAIRCLFSSEIPNNAGIFRPIEVIAPEGSILNPVLPGAVAARGLTVYRMCDAMFGALAQIAPDRVPACGEGGNSGISIGGYDERRDPFIFVEFICNAWGGHPKKDGPDGITNPFANMCNTPVEMMELAYPLRVEQYALVSDSGGPGRFRGGMAAAKDIRLLGKEAVLQVRSDRRHFRSFGLNGGGQGAPSYNYLNPEQGGDLLPTKVTMTIRQGDLFRHITAGAAGWGSPLERDPELVRHDAVLEKISLESASGDYGVVLDPETLQLNHAATRALRKSMAAGLHAAEVR